MRKKSYIGGFIPYIFFLIKTYCLEYTNGGGTQVRTHTQGSGIKEYNTQMDFLKRKNKKKIYQTTYILFYQGKRRTN